MYTYRSLYIIIISRLMTYLLIYLYNYYSIIFIYESLMFGGINMIDIGLKEISRSYISLNNNIINFAIHMYIHSTYYII